ncbi:MAG: ribose-phosphate pyrophosphokinase [Methylacidiphilales bacterium]|nr:ribose-phosphate pyrophosphokinase [Candidatus Methylacidiphilales bacterium]
MLQYGVAFRLAAIARQRDNPRTMDTSGPQVFSGNANPGLAQEIADYVGVPLGEAVVTSFPNGETFVKINENIRGRDIYIVQPTAPPTNQNLMELLIMIDAARRASASRITAVVPFYGYARQDRKDQPRVPITAKLVANLLVASGAHRILTMDLHAQQIQGFFDIPVDHLYAAPTLYRYLSSLKLDKLIVVSPDVGGMKMASAYSQLLHTGLAIVAKRRTSPTSVESQYLVGEVEGKDVLLVDDLTETAGTLAAAAKLVKAHGARRVLAAVSHCLLSDLAVKRLQESVLDELVTTNSTIVRPIPGCKITVLSIAPLLGEAIKRINGGESVSSLFEINGHGNKDKI